MPRALRRARLYRSLRDIVDAVARALPLYIKPADVEGNTGDDDRVLGAATSGHDREEVATRPFWRTADRCIKDLGAHLRRARQRVRRTGRSLRDPRAVVSV